MGRKATVHRSGYVRSFGTIDQYCKAIGIARSTYYKRMQNYEATDIEKRMHTQLAVYRHRGEWFIDCEFVQKYISIVRIG